MSEDVSVSYLGPEHSHSHVIVQSAFPEWSHICYERLDAVVKAAETGAVDFAFVPFHNTSALNIEHSQSAIISASTKLHICGVVGRHIVHTLGGFCPLTDVAVIRTFKPAIEQISEWKAQNLPQARFEEDPKSTSAAVLWVRDNKPEHTAAVSTKAAFVAYEVPVLVEGIENKRNTTLFFLVGRDDPKWEAPHLTALIAAPSDPPPEPEAADEFGLAVTESWRVKDAAPQPIVWQVFVLNAARPEIDFLAAVKQFTDKSNGHILGAYPGPSTVELKKSDGDGYYC